MNERSIRLPLDPGVYIDISAFLITMMLSVIIILFVYSLSMNSDMSSDPSERFRKPWNPPVVTDLGPLIDKENLS